MEYALNETPLTYALLAVTIATSLYAFSDRSFLEGSLYHNRAVAQGREYHRLITPAFLHGDPGHLIVNMVTLFFFGPAVEYIYGTANFAIIYFGSQLAAKALTFVAKRRDPEYRSLGASGAISGVVLAFCVHAPMATIYAFFAIPMPAIVFGALYLAYTTLAMGGRGQIAHEAHLGGALGGAALAFLLAP